MSMLSPSAEGMPVAKNAIAFLSLDALSCHFDQKIVKLVSSQNYGGSSISHITVNGVRSVLISPVSGCCVLITNLD